MTGARALRAAAGIATAVAVLVPVMSGGEPHGAWHMHTIAPGDSLWTIARRYGVSVAAIVAANHLPNERVKLKLGRRLTIPAPDTPRSPAHATTSSRGTAAWRPPSSPRSPADILLAVPQFAEEPPAFAWPAEGAVISPFGRRVTGWHRGIDIKAPPGSAILSAAPGIVVTSGVETHYGRIVRIEHDQGFVTVYAHNEDNLVTVGDRVAAGEKIATVGRTGRATTYHVHFEIQYAGRFVNPLYLLPHPATVRVDETTEEPE